MISTLALCSLALIKADYGVSDIVQPAFKDASFTATILKSDQAELKKINKDFAASQRFGTTKALIKEPNMMRMQSTVEDTDVYMLIVGSTRTLYVPRIKMKQSTDLAKAPGKRQTPLDFGILTPSLFKNLFTAQFVRVDRETSALVFDLTFEKPRYDDTSRQRIWVDKEKRYVIRRAWFNQEGRQLATFYYEKPQQENGVWLPTKCTVKNVDDKVAGVTEYQSMKINSGLSDSLFKL